MIRAFIFVLLDIYLWIVTDPQKDREPLISTLSPQPRNGSKFTSSGGAQTVRRFEGEHAVGSSQAVRGRTATCRASTARCATSC